LVPSVLLFDSQRNSKHKSNIIATNNSKSNDVLHVGVLLPWLEKSLQSVMLSSFVKKGLSISYLRVKKWKEILWQLQRSVFQFESSSPNQNGESSLQNVVNADCCHTLRANSRTQDNAL
jgi:hypothetical protein